MAITLTPENLPARLTYQGSETISVAAGKHLKIETTPAGVEILDATVPAGKTWEATINVYVKET